MSKLSFRARALDATKPMPVFCSEEIPDLPDFAAINRAVPQMPTGMEKEEECEHHLQRAISAQQAFGHTGELVIPTPEVYTAAVEEYELLYPTNYKAPRQMIHMQPFSMDQDIPDYDMDSEDEKWINQQTRKMEITPLQFEEIMDRLEKSSGQQVVTLKEAKLLLKEDDDLIIAVYDYWLNKRLKMQHPLIPQVKTEKRDGSTNNNPYVAFRRRTEKMQTRKNRKNDEASYEKMLKLRRDLSRAVTLLEMVKRREKTKREHLHLTIEIFEKRYQAGDFSGQILAEVSALKHTRPNYLTVNNQVIKQEGRVSKHKDEGVPRKKREYTKRKNKQDSLAAQAHVPQRSEIDPGFSDLLSSEDEGLSPATSPSDQEEDNDPDGQFAFRRKRYCNYHTPLIERLGNWPWCGPEEGGIGDKRYRFCLTSLALPRPKCIGFARRRIGRGGRVILDRTWTPLDDYWADLDFSISHSLPNGLPSSEFLSEIKNEWVHFRPQTPNPAECSENTHLVDEQEHVLQCSSEETPGPSDSVPTDIDFESFQNHQEELFEMQRKQLERLKQEELISDATPTSEHSFSSQPTSRFTLDSASVQFAVSAVLSTSELSGILNSLTTHTPPSVAVTNNKVTSSTAGRRVLTNGPTVANTEANICCTESGACFDSSIVVDTDSVIEFALPGGVSSSSPACIHVAPSTELESGSSFSNTNNPQSLGVISIKSVTPTPVQHGLRIPSSELNGSEKQSATSEDFSLSKVKLEAVTTDCGFPMDVT